MVFLLGRNIKQYESKVTYAVRIVAINKTDCELVKKPPCSPDLVSIDYHTKKSIQCKIVIKYLQHCKCVKGWKIVS